MEALLLSQVPIDLNLVLTHVIFWNYAGKGLTIYIR